MHRIFGEFKKAEVIFIRDPEMEVELTAYIWHKLDKHIALYIPDVGVAIACLHCENTTRVDLITKAINDYLTSTHTNLFTREQEIRFPQRYRSVVDDGIVLASFASEDDAYEFKRRHDCAKIEEW
jgi:hypothetical protein